jgi:hypothetical protein
LVKAVMAELHFVFRLRVVVVRREAVVVVAAAV